MHPCFGTRRHIPGYASSSCLSARKSIPLIILLFNLEYHYKIFQPTIQQIKDPKSQCYKVGTDVCIIKGVDILIKREWL